MLLLIVVYFLIGAVAGGIFSFLWEIHWISKVVLFIICAATVTFVLFDVGGFIASFDVWYIELSQFTGIMMGNPVGKRIGQERALRP